MHKLMFYCFYVAMYKKGVHKDTAPTRANIMLTATFFFFFLWIIPIYFIITGKSPQDTITKNEVILYIVGLALMFIIHISNYYILIYDNRYRTIIEKLDSKYSKKGKILLGVTGVVLFFCALFGFCTLGMYLPSLQELTRSLGIF